ncbi:unnamed protein product [Adineta steineri]|uniref:Septin-type G domain-containing protein n=1 Tax=Adineta steineri TaxID=433720 RepID=A0A815K794_9BILA|nr:unnamed protein product [Adineta steineri]CAF3997045.1 unnamed protein product [Adineta steineri]
MDASIPVDTTANNPLIFSKESAVSSNSNSQEPLKDSSSTTSQTTAILETQASDQTQPKSAAYGLLTDAKVVKLGKDGYPTIYKVGFKEHIIDTGSCLRKCHIGQQIPVHGCYPPEKNIMILGATGAGKSTMVNALVNYYYGVQWNDDFRLKLITEEDEGQEGVAKSQAKSQTSWITAYTLHQQPGCSLPFTLTLIDTPGYGDSEGIKRDAEITKQIRELFTIQGDNGIDHIDAIGFVVQSSVARLTHTQKYVFDSILSLFGKNIASNIMLIITFCDGQTPPVLTALAEAQVPYEKSFKFNNSSLFSRNNFSENTNDLAGKFDYMFWDLGISSLQQFFLDFQKVQPVSLSLTQETLKERHRLEITVQGIQPQIQNGLSKLETLRQEAVVMKKHVVDINDNKGFKYTVKVQKCRKVDLKPGEVVTSCIVCNQVCHYPCETAQYADKRQCAAISGDNCIVCPGKCHWNKHFGHSYRFESYEEEETRTACDTLKRYENAKKELKTKKEILGLLLDDFKKTQVDVIELISNARKAIQRLDQIALKSNPLSVVDYIDLMIESEKKEGKQGFQERIKHLEIIKKQAEIIQDLKDADFDPFKDVINEIEVFKDIKISADVKQDAGLLSRLADILK